MLQVSTLSAPSHKNDEIKPTTLRILVVDDNRDVVDSLVMLLEALSYKVLATNDGLQAIEVAKNYRPEVVLLDIGLPKLDGYGVCSRIREQAWGKDMKILAMSGKERDDDLEKSRGSGFTEYLVKPVSPELLLRLLAGYECVP